MMTFKKFAGKLKTIPAGTAWYPADLGETWPRSSLAEEIGTIPN